MTTIEWKPNQSAPLWDIEGEGDVDSNGVCKLQGSFFTDLKIDHLRQSGPSCVPTTLAMLANANGADVTPEHFMPFINSQSPHSWSEALAPFGMQLAYCNVDLRRLSFYMDELMAMDDLFLLSFYSTDPPYEPDANGKLCTAHIVTLHRDTIIDTAKPEPISAKDYSRQERQTKRIFRVVPRGHPRSV